MKKKPLFIKKKPFSSKRWVALTLSLLFAAWTGVAGVVFVVDPFEIYRKAARFIPPITGGTQSYSNAGIAKSWDYDSIIIGSSMTENFLPSQLRELLGGSFVKLCVNGGSPYNHRQMMEIAFRTHDVRRVLYCIDADALTWFYTQPKTEMPDYLYDESVPNDVHYWFNSSVLANYIPKCLRTWGQSDPDQRDTMYSWGDLYPYGREYALSGISFDGRAREQKETQGPYTMSQQTKLNVEHNFLPFIEDHPDTEFIFFFPPYSLAKWYAFYRSGNLTYHLHQASAVSGVLLEHGNVKVYDFRTRIEWITDLNNYIDSYHYGPWINREIAEDIAAGRCRVTDAVQVNENSEIIMGLVDRIVEAGGWPEDLFPAAPGGGE